MPNPVLKPWIDDLQAAGRYTFLRSEALEKSGISAGALSRSLRQAEQDERIVKLKNYFYAIIPLEYRVAGSPPPSWFIDKLMQAMQLPYYTGLLTAASYYGAILQQPQVFQVITNKPVRPIIADRTRIHFFTNKFCEDAAVQAINTPTGTMLVSAATTTVLDLIRFMNASGGLSHVASVILSLADSIKEQKLEKALDHVCDIPNTQRLGYVFDVLGYKNLAFIVNNWLKSHRLRLQPLLPGKGIDGAIRNKKWQLRINAKLEIEY